MPEVAGTKITVTKKRPLSSWTNNRLWKIMICRTFFSRRRVSRSRIKHTPGQFNFNYRGLLGNPQESEFTLVLRDGLPLMSDRIGFPIFTICRYLKP